MRYFSEQFNFSGEIYKSDDKSHSIYKNQLLVAELVMDKTLRFVLDDGNILEFKALKNYNYSLRILDYPSGKVKKDVTSKEHHPEVVKLIKNNLKKIEQVSFDNGSWGAINNLLFALENSKDIDIRDPVLLFQLQSDLKVPESRSKALSLIGLQPINSKEYCKKPAAIPFNVVLKDKKTGLPNRSAAHIVTVVYGPESDKGYASNVVINHGTIFGDTKNIHDRKGSGPSSRNYKLNDKLLQKDYNCGFISADLVTKINKEINKLVDNGTNFSKLAGKDKYDRIESLIDKFFTRTDPSKNGVTYNNENEYITTRRNTYSGLFSIGPYTTLLGYAKNLKKLYNKLVDNIEVSMISNKNDIVRTGLESHNRINEHIYNLTDKDAEDIRNVIKAIISFNSDIDNSLIDFYSKIEFLDLSNKVNRIKVLDDFKDKIENIPSDVVDVNQYKYSVYSNINKQLNIAIKSARENEEKYKFIAENKAKTIVTKLRDDLFETRYANDLKSKYDVTNMLMTNTLFTNEDKLKDIPQNKTVIVSTINKLASLRGESVYDSSQSLLLKYNSQINRIEQMSYKSQYKLGCKITNAEVVDKLLTERIYDNSAEFVNDCINLTLAHGILNNHHKNIKEVSKRIEYLTENFIMKNLRFKSLKSGDRSKFVNGVLTKFQDDMNSISPEKVKSETEKLKNSLDKLLPEHKVSILPITK
ncbi:MAG: hypothetical protein Ta2D_04510 [Rickettsiales bacterium]|nr:MAG: hypothetical protein Ta2D_04510 [Rickettsiales bacterium]